MTDLPKILAEIHNAQDALRRAEDLLRPVVLASVAKPKEQNEALNQDANATPAAETLNPAASGGEGWPRYWLSHIRTIYMARNAKDPGWFWSSREHRWVRSAAGSLLNCIKEHPESWKRELTRAEAAKLGAKVWSNFFQEELHAATKQEANAQWLGGKRGQYFRCCLCGRHLKEGDMFRVVYTNDMPNAGGNPLVCAMCNASTPAVRQAWAERCAEAYADKFWWFMRK